MSYTKLTDFAAKDALLSGNPSKLLRGTEIGAEFDAIESAMAAAEAVNITAPIIAASTSKTTPVDADVLPILDSAAANIMKKVTWVNIKATLKTYFDTLYAAVGSFAASGANADITSLTALTAGGLPDNSILTNDIAALQVTGAKIAASTVSPDKLTQPITLETAVTTSGGSAYGFTSIPSWVKRVTCLFSAVSTAGSFNVGLQIGSGSYATTGYNGTLSALNGATGSSNNLSTSIVIDNAANPVNLRYGSIVLTHMGGNLWAFDGIASCAGSSITAFIAGTIQLAGALDRVQIMLNGATTFDGGTFNILYE